MKFIFIPNSVLFLSVDISEHFLLCFFSSMNSFDKMSNGSMISLPCYFLATFLHELDYGCWCVFVFVVVVIVHTEREKSIYQFHDRITIGKNWSWNDHVCIRVHL